MKLPLFNKTGNHETAIDPVCDMNVVTQNPPGGTHEFENVTYYFCGPGCRVAFSKEPPSYLTGSKKIQM